MEVYVGASFNACIEVYGMRISGQFDICMRIGTLVNVRVYLFKPTERHNLSFSYSGFQTVVATIGLNYITCYINLRLFTYMSTL